MKHRSPAALAALASVAAFGWVVPAPASEIALHAYLEGVEPGPTLVVTAPPPRHRNDVGLAAQLASLEARAGHLVILTADSATTPEGALAFATAYLSSEPEVLLVNHIGAADYPWVAAPEDGPVIVTPEGNYTDLTAELFGGTATVEADPALSAGGTDIVLFLNPEGERLSRQVRWGRQFAMGVLDHHGVTDTGNHFDWHKLARDLDTEFIGIYDAEGTGGLGAVRVETALDTLQPHMRVARLCGEDVREGAIDAFHAGVFPGGSATGILNALEPEGVETVRGFVRNGGGYLGICAGAYAVGSYRENYFGLIGLRHNQPWRRGNDHIDVELTPEGIALYGEQFARFNTRYANGPVFLEQDDYLPGDPIMGEFTVLARFATPSTDRDGVVREEMVGTPAIGTATYGDGRAFFISPHPETHPELHSIITDSILHILPERTAGEPEEEPATTGEQRASLM